MKESDLPERRFKGLDMRKFLRRWAVLVILLPLLGASGGRDRRQGVPAGSGGEAGLIGKVRGRLQNVFSSQVRYRCREKVWQEENIYEVVLTKLMTGEQRRRWDLRREKSREATYDYRLALRGKKISERRRPLSADNEILYEAKDTGALIPYKEKNVFFSPWEVLGRLAREDYEFLPEGVERIGEIEAQIFRFAPKGFAEPRPRGALTGSLWAHPETGAVLRLLLDPGNWTFFESADIPKVFEAVPKFGHAALKRALSWTADFSPGDGGCPLPWRIEVAESYGDGGGETLETNRWEMLYDSYVVEPGLPVRPAALPNAVLTKAGDYCDRLKSVALNYICDEHIVRTSSLYDARRFVKLAGELPRIRWELKRTSTREVVYDYQLIKKGDQLEERRKALTVDGRTWRRNELPPNILPYQAQYIVYGPVGFLSKYWQSRFDYFEEEPEKLSDGVPAAVFTSQPNEWREENSVYGRLWIDPETGAVRRLSWDPESIDFFHPEDVQKSFVGLIKQLVWTAEYGVEKNGIFFPSRQDIREEYVGPAGEVIVGEVWTVTYENYRFFNVGVDVVIK